MTAQGTGPTSLASPLYNNVGFQSPITCAQGEVIFEVVRMSQPQNECSWRTLGYAALQRLGRAFHGMRTGVVGNEQRTGD